MQFLFRSILIRYILRRLLEKLSVMKFDFTWNIKIQLILLIHWSFWVFRLSNLINDHLLKITLYLFTSLPRISFVWRLFAFFKVLAGRWFIYITYRVFTNAVTNLFPFSPFSDPGCVRTTRASNVVVICLVWNGIRKKNCWRYPKLVKMPGPPYNISDVFIIK